MNGERVRLPAMSAKQTNSEKLDMGNGNFSMLRLNSLCFVEGFAVPFSTRSGFQYGFVLLFVEKDLKSFLKLVVVFERSDDPAHLVIVSSYNLKT